MLVIIENEWAVQNKYVEELVVSDPGQSLSIQFQILITTKQSSVNELSNATFNTSKETNSTNDLIENSIFDEDRFNTKPKQHTHDNREAANGNCVNDDKARTERDSMIQFTARKTERFKHIICSSNYNAIILTWSSKSFWIECKESLIE